MKEQETKFILTLVQFGGGIKLNNHFHLIDVAQNDMPDNTKASWL